MSIERRRERVAKGAALLRRKREALVAELFRLARPAVTARVSIADRARTAYRSLLGALAVEGFAGVRTAGWPPRDIRVSIRAGQLWGIAISELVDRPAIRRTLAARATPPPGTGPAVTTTADGFEELTEMLLDAANREALLRRLGDAVARTSRQVNTLERRLGPTLAAQRALIRRTLDEREREEHLRLERLLKKRRH
jgi:V/A-type H+-transporting ATPase subunit D